MSTLAAMLRCLSRSDIREVRLQTDVAAMASTVSGAVAPLTRGPLTSAQITRLVDGTQIAGALAELRDGQPAKLSFELEEVPLAVELMRRASRLQLRFCRAAPPAAAAATDAPARGPQPETSSPSATMLPRPAGLPARALAAAPPAAAPVRAAVAHAAGPTIDTHFLAIVAAAYAHGASDVHIAPHMPVRLRRHGALEAQGDVLPTAQAQAMLEGLLHAREQQSFAATGYADFALNLPDGGRLRANICRTSAGLKGCFRLVSRSVPTLAGLGLPQDLEAVAKYHQGLVVISGPNGQGKTSTLAALVDLINATSPLHIITVEDPIEIVHPVRRAVISQREVGTHTQSFARALKASLREDPDVIVIGELRDRETVEIALTAAETGHLVMATMSTRSAAKTIDRLIDLFPFDEQPQVRATLAGALKVIVSQRLVPAVGGGTVAAAELITGSVPLWSLIRDNKLFQLGSLQQRGRSLGMIKFDTSLYELVQAGKISVDTAKQWAENAPELERALSAGPAVQPARAAQVAQRPAAVRPSGSPTATKQDT